MRTLARLTCSARTTFAGLALLGLAPMAHAAIVTNGSVEIGAPVGGWTAGAYFLDLTGSFGAGGGVIYQDLATPIGTQFNLSFYFGANPGWQYLGFRNDGTVKSLQVLLNDALASQFSQDTTRLTFRSLNSANGTLFGPYLDGVNVSAVAVREPGTLVLLGLGLALLGVVRRNSRANESVVGTQGRHYKRASSA